MASRLETLRAQRTRHVQIRDRARRERRPAVVAQQNRIIADIDRKIEALTPARSMKRVRPPKHPNDAQGNQATPEPKRVEGAVRLRAIPKPKGVYDSKAGVPITPANADEMIIHYRRLMWSLPILSKARGYAHDRLALARRMMHRPMTARTQAAIAKKGQLEAAIQTQRAQAEKARRARQYGAVARHQQLIDGYERQIAVIRAKEGSEGIPEHYGPVSYTEEAGYSKEPGASASASVEADADSVSASADVDVGLPWYKRFAIPLAVAAIVGIGAAYARKGKGSRGVASSSGSAPARRSFTVKNRKSA